MIDLTTTYLGLNLKNPLVAGASPLTEDLDNIRRMEDAGAGAIVLHSLFEEQIALESQEIERLLRDRSRSVADSLTDLPDVAWTYLPDVTWYNRGPDGYLEHLYRAKKSVGIPIISSLNCVSPGRWTEYARKMQQAGADALELNIYLLPTDPDITSGDVERMSCDLVREVKTTLRIPVAVKLSPYFSALANMAGRLDQAGADALVLFNRFYQPDFDLEKLEVLPHLALSSSYELLLRLHWVAVLYGRVRPELAVTGGVHTAEDVVKAMMAGAQVAMMTSALLKHGIDHFTGILAGLAKWMEEHGYESIRRMRGSMGWSSVADPTVFARANYMRVLTSYALRMPGSGPP